MFAAVEKAESRRIGTVDPVGFGRGFYRGCPVYIFQYLVDDSSLCGKRANRVRNPCIFCQQKGLAPAAAEIALSTVATSARLQHPFLAAEFLKRSGLLPNLPKRLRLNVFKCHARQHARRVAWQHVSDRCNKY